MFRKECFEKPTLRVQSPRNGSRLEPRDFTEGFDLDVPGALLGVVRGIDFQTSTHSPAPPHRRIELMTKLGNLRTGVRSECDGFFYPIRQLRSDSRIVLIGLLRSLVWSTETIADPWIPEKIQPSFNQES